MSDWRAAAEGRVTVSAVYAWYVREGGTYDADAVDAVELAVLALRVLRLDEVVEALAAVLLHALEAEVYVDGKLEVERLVHFEHVQPAEEDPCRRWNHDQ